MIVLDASVLIAHLDRTDAAHSRARAMLLATADFPVAASSITLAEVLVGPARTDRLALAQEALRDLAVAEVPVPAGAAARLAELRADTGLKLPDCCVLLAAEEVSADAVLTFDDRLGKRARDLGYGWEPDATGPEPGPGARP
jgi:predicted nucleic acid-binding protein